LDSLTVQKDLDIVGTAMSLAYAHPLLAGVYLGSTFFVTAGIGAAKDFIGERRKYKKVFEILKKEYNLSSSELKEIEKAIAKDVKKCIKEENMTPEECAKQFKLVKGNAIKQLFVKFMHKFSGKTKYAIVAIATAVSLATVIVLGKKYLKIDAPVYSLKFWKAIAEYLKDPKGSKKVKALILVTSGIALVGLALLGFTGAKLLLKKAKQLLKKEG